MGEEWDFLVSNSTSVIDLKLSIFTKLNRMHPDTQVSTLKIPWDMWQCHIVTPLRRFYQVLIYQGEEMEEDNETMAEYDIQARDIHFIQPPLMPSL